MRKKFIAGNWKMYGDSTPADLPAAAAVRGAGGDDRVPAPLCPPFPYLARVFQTVRGTPVALGAQNLYPAKEGAFTGEVSPAMLLDVGCEYAIVGHSERRHVLGESDAFVRQKVLAGLEAGLTVILCVGETIQQRQAGASEEVLR